MIRMLGVGAALVWCCAATAQTTAEMAEDAAREVKAAEEYEAEVFRDLRALSTPEQQAKLDASETAWRAYRDAAIETMIAMYDGGTASGLAGANAKLNLTNQRITMLLTYFPDDYERPEEAPPADPKSLIVPGASVGAIRIGMTKDEVRAALGKAGEETAAIWRYVSASSGNKLTMYFDTSGNLMQAAWTSPSFKTNDLVSTAATPGLADVTWFVYTAPNDPKAVKYVSAEGGLAFYYVFPSGARDGEPSSGVGCIFAGEDPPVDLVSPDGGWVLLGG